MKIFNCKVVCLKPYSCCKWKKKIEIFEVKLYSLFITYVWAEM